MADLDTAKNRFEVESPEIKPDIEENIAPQNPPEEQKAPSIPKEAHEVTPHDVVTQRNLFKRLQSIREYNKFKIELKHQATLKKQDTISHFMRQSSTGRSGRIAPEEKSQMQSLVRKSFHQKKKFFALLMEQVT